MGDRTALPDPEQLVGVLAEAGLPVALADRDGGLTMPSPALTELVGPRDRALRLQEVEEHSSVTALPLGSQADGRQAVLFQLDRSALQYDDEELTAARRLLADAIHQEIRTPLSSVVGHVRLLADPSLELPPEAQRSLSAILRAAAKLRGGVSTVLLLLESRDPSPYADEWFDVGRLVQSVVTAQGAEALRAGVRVSADVEEGIWTTGRVDAIRRVVQQLVESALTHAPVGSAVLAWVALSDGLVRVWVVERGPGEPLEDEARVLQRFEIGALSSERDRGRDLGLALAEAVARAHGGRVRFLDNPEGGQAVCLELPLTDDAGDRPS